MGSEIYHIVQNNCTTTGKDSDEEVNEKMPSHSDEKDVFEVVLKYIECLMAVVPYTPASHTSVAFYHPSPRRCRLRAPQTVCVVDGDDRLVVVRFGPVETRD